MPNQAIEWAKRAIDSAVKAMTWQHAIRVFLLVLLPFLIGAVFLQHQENAAGNQLQITSENRTQLTDSMVYTSIHNGTGLDQVRTVSTLFPLASYMDFPPFVRHMNTQICFDDKGSQLLTANNTTINPLIEWTVEIDGAKNITFNSSTVSCEAFEKAEGMNYVWHAKIDTNVTFGEIGGQVIFVPDVVAYPKSTIDYGVLQGIALIPVFYLLIWYPLFGIIKKVKEGMNAQ